MSSLCPEGLGHKRHSDTSSRNEEGTVDHLKVKVAGEGLGSWGVLRMVQGQETHSVGTEPCSSLRLDHQQERQPADGR